MLLTVLLFSAALAAQDPTDQSALPDGPQPYQPSAPVSSPQSSTPQPYTPRPAAAPFPGDPVMVDAYRRDYEGPKDGRELNYETTIYQAYNAKQSQVGMMEGSWAVTGADGDQILAIELRNEGAGMVGGAWRALKTGYGMRSSGLLSDASVTGRDVELNYFVGAAHSPVVMHFTRGGDGVWRGYMMDPAGTKTPATLTQIRAGN